MSKNKQKLLLIIYILGILLFLGGATYAYFTVIRVSSIAPEAKIKSATTEFLYFRVGDDLSIVADEINFKKGNNSLKSDSYLEAKLIKGDADVKMTHKYNIDFNINSNNFIYSISDDKPELLLKIVGPNGELKVIQGLEYKEVTDNKGINHSGFDITTKTGTFSIQKEYIIETDDETVQNWDFSVSMINYVENQDDNKGKSFQGDIRVEKVI